MTVDTETRFDDYATPHRPSRRSSLPSTDEVTDALPRLLEERTGVRLRVVVAAGAILVARAVIGAVE